jgi:hypothetical protein
MPLPGESEPFEYGGVEHEPSDLVKDVGKNARDVGVTTRHATGHDGSEEGEVDVPRTIPGRPTAPIGDDPADDGAPTRVVDFAPRDATPPTVVP